jgi:L,D-peptidoglycan transpeptidase YkuD (ErfK/YbiS/YcfS/YnhG family)
MEDIIEVNAMGILSWKGIQYRCALGRGGIVHDKKEGDGATPAGTFALREVFFRSDRIAKPSTALPVIALTPHDGWCDAADDPHYNTRVTLPYGASAESLWREDHLYDVIVVVGYNDDPPVPGKGSAIFMHVAREEYSPTAGCIALALPDLLKILETVSPDTRIALS